MLGPGFRMGSTVMCLSVWRRVRGTTEPDVCELAMTIPEMKNWMVCDSTQTARTATAGISPHKPLHRFFLSGLVVPSWLSTDLTATATG